MSRLAGQVHRDDGAELNVHSLARELQPGWVPIPLGWARRRTCRRYTDGIDAKACEDRFVDARMAGSGVHKGNTWDSGREHNALRLKQSSEGARNVHEDIEDGATCLQTSRTRVARRIAEEPIVCWRHE